MEYNVVMGSFHGHTPNAIYGGFFGQRDWQNASNAIPFSSLPNTSCCGFGYVETQPAGFNFNEESIEQFIQKAHFSGFILKQKRARDPLTGKTFVDMAEAISARHEKVYKLHYKLIEEPDVHIFIAEILDCKEFEALRKA